jgi:hypothetical protein
MKINEKEITRVLYCDRPTIQDTPMPIAARMINRMHRSIPYPVKAEISALIRGISVLSAVK